MFATSDLVPGSISCCSRFLSLRHMREAELARHAAGAQQQQQQQLQLHERKAAAKVRMRRERWRSFVRDQTHGRLHPPTWKELGEKWAKMSEDDKNDFVRRREAAAPTQPAAAASTLPAAWSAWGLGSEAWPLSTVYAEDISQGQVLGLLTVCS